MEELEELESQNLNKIRAQNEQEEPKNFNIEEPELTKQRNDPLSPSRPKIFSPSPSPVAERTLKISNGPYDPAIVTYHVQQGFR
jgi:hypothetical protein